MLKIAPLFLAAATALLCAAARSDTTNTVDVAALAACGTGTTNGWTVAGIDSYVDKTKPNIRINANGEFVESPAFPLPVKRILLSAFSSSDSGRRLVVQPLDDNSCIAGESRWRFCDCSAGRREYEIEFSRDENIRSFRLDRESGTLNTGWGIFSLSVVTFDPPSAATPADVSAADVRRSSFTVHWAADAAAASHEVAVYEVRHAAESYEVVQFYSFDEFSNDGGNASNCTESVVAKYPALAGSALLYLMPHSQGMIRISSRETRGTLVHSAFGDCSNLSLALTMRKSADDDSDDVDIAYEDSDGSTNSIVHVAISNEFRHVVVPLSSACDNRPIIVNASGNKTKHCVVVDEMSILRNYEAESTTTNFVKKVVAQRADMAWVKGLEPGTDYLVSVTATDAAGAASKPSEPIAVRTTRGADQGLRITLR